MQKIWANELQFWGKIGKIFIPCAKGHKYLFSEETADWNEAKEMCQILGGYLVKIENRHENNCLLVYAMNNGLEDEWWRTSGKSK